MAKPKKVRVATGSGPVDHPVVPRAQWLKARSALLKQEKAFAKLGDQLARRRRALPWVQVEKAYEFDGPGGPVTLAGLFGKRSQLIVYHFMFAPEWGAGCPHCSFWADHYDGPTLHLGQRDTAFAVISRAPIEKIEAFKKRMGWSFRWLSSAGSDFNYDFHVSFRPEEAASKTVDYNYGKVPYEGSDKPGLSAFLRDGADVFHTYSTYERGLEFLISTYSYLDLTPLGRQEGDLSFPMAWVRHHDKYVAA